MCSTHSANAGSVYNTNAINSWQCTPFGVGHCKHYLLVAVVKTTFMTSVASVPGLPGTEAQVPGALYSRIARGLSQPRYLSPVSPGT